MSQVDLRPLERHWNCRLTVRGRRSGEPRTVTMWFALDPAARRIYLTGSGEPPQWVRNVRAHEAAGGAVTVQIGATRLHGRARVVDDPAEAEAIRLRFVRRYLGARLARLLGRGYVDSTAVVVAQLRASEADG
ncbi:MAG: nitroreductase family deazaflavin-dependent oxidoreductase [Deltaproteobacteria bacterium]|nr:nitroreductase family deazaflavin-dependent oxidoreductase [Deltaproteobacteria bacterium]